MSTIEVNGEKCVNSVCSNVCQDRGYGDGECVMISRHRTRVSRCSCGVVFAQMPMANRKRINVQLNRFLNKCKVDRGNCYELLESIDWPNDWHFKKGLSEVDVKGKPVSKKGNRGRYQVVTPSSALKSGSLLKKSAESATDSAELPDVSPTTVQDLSTSPITVTTDDTNSLNSSTTDDLSSLAKLFGEATTNKSSNNTQHSTSNPIQITPVDNPAN